MEGPCPTVLLNADTGADVNLLNSSTFDKIIGDRSLLQPSTLRMEAYRNSTVYQYLGKFYMFLRWKGRVYKQLFYIMTANASPNSTIQRWLLHTRNAETLLLSGNLSKSSSTQPKTDLEQCQMHGD